MALPGTKLFVGGIPAPNANPESLAELFEEQGAALLEVVVLQPKGTNPQTRCAFVRVQDEIASYVCEALNGMMFEGHVSPLVVRLADEVGKSKGAGAVNPPAGAAYQHVQKPAAPAAMGYPPAGAAYQQASSSGKEQAIAQGSFIEAAECREQEFAAAGETREAKLQRLCRALHVAAVQEHYFEAAAVYDALLHMDPFAAAAALATTCAASAAASGGPTAGGPHRPPAAAYPPPPSSKPPYNGMAPPAAEGALKDYLGHIITFNQERRYGFIQCPELGADAFLSDRQLGNFQQGSQVRFNVSYNPQGKPQAQNLREPQEEGSPAAKRHRPS